MCLCFSLFHYQKKDVYLYNIFAFVRFIRKNSKIFFFTQFHSNHLWMDEWIQGKTKITTTTKKLPHFHKNTHLFFFLIHHHWTLSLDQYLLLIWWRQIMVITRCSWNNQANQPTDPTIENDDDDDDNWTAVNRIAFFLHHKIMMIIIGNNDKIVTFVKKWLCKLRTRRIGKFFFVFFFNTKIESTKEWIFDTFLNSDSDRNTTHTYTVELFFFILFWDGWLNFIQSFFFHHSIIHSVSFNHSICVRVCVCVDWWICVFFSLKKNSASFFSGILLILNFWLNEWMNVWMDGWLDEWIDGCESMHERRSQLTTTSKIIIINTIAIQKFAIHSQSVSQSNSKLLVTVIAESSRLYVTLIIS